MASVSRSAMVPYSAQAMFDLVDDVNAYQEFLPWVKSSRERYRDEDTVEATLVFAKGGFEKSFTTRNRLQHGKMIELRLVEGPFRHLHGYWQFHRLDEQASRVSLDLEFEFASRLLSAAFGRVFTQVANTLVDSFVQRARQVYG